ncbi:MAG: molybdopterin-binding protein [Alphaproteobacteria bacterium]|nr:molybdopterin-binding protein [Alphaproteobacteria bacterium]
MLEIPECPTAAVLIIGNEILSGRTQDINLNVIARKLLALGIRLAEARVVRDDEAAIVEAVNALREAYTYIFTTGGIGPTHDDITTPSIAKAFGLPVSRHPEALALLTAYYTPANLNPERLRMADMPEGACLIDNPVSVIPGFQIGNVFVFAGVPEVMLAMLDSVAQTIRGGPCIHAVTINCDLTEGILAGELAGVASRFASLDIGSYPSFRLGKIGVALVVRGTNRQAVDEATAEIVALVTRLGGNPEIEASV